MLTGLIGFYLGGALVVGTATSSATGNVGAAFLSAALWPISLVLKTSGLDDR